MLKRLIATINRTADAAGKDNASHSKQDLVSWATGCMWEGLPENFYSAWLEVTRSGDAVEAHYRCIIEEGGEVEQFQAADDLYPIQCIEHLDEHLPQQKRNWKKCVLTFNPETASLDYEY
jgi:hypothetical protein